jgi:hypothetical protein
LAWCTNWPPGGAGIGGDDRGFDAELIGRADLGARARMLEIADQYDQLAAFARNNVRRIRRVMDPKDRHPHGPAMNLGNICRARLARARRYGLDGAGVPFCTELVGSVRVGGAFDPPTAPVLLPRSPD